MIIDSNLKTSKQADLVMYHDFMPFIDFCFTKYFLYGGFAVYIEVKSDLSGDDLKDVLNIVKSFNLDFI